MDEILGRRSTRLAGAVAVAAAMVLLSPGIAAAHSSDPPAGGAPVGSVITALLVTGAGVAGLLWLARAYRKRRANGFRGLEDSLARALDVPAWAALPFVVTLSSLTLSLLGFYWDVSIHIDKGRDSDLFANPAHWLVAFGLAGTFTGGILAVVIGTDGPTRTSIRIRDGWHAPVSGVAILACGVVAGLGFPLDDLWHRIAGQDVSLWGPMHLVDVGGSELAAIAMWALLVEAIREQRPRRRPVLIWLLPAMMSGALLISFVDFQAEYDFGAPAFSLLYHPFLVAAAAGALIACRVALGRGGALVCAVAFLIIRFDVYLFVGKLMHRTPPVFPLFVGSAVIVELVALVVPRRRTATFGLVAGLGVGTIGLAAERLWINEVFAFSWPDSMLPRAALFGIVGGVSAGLLGALLGRVLAPEPFGGHAVPRPLIVLATGAYVAGMIVLSPRNAPSGITAQVELASVRDGAATAVVTLDPPDAANDAYWFTVFAFRGGTREVVPLERLGPGRYRTKDAFPVGGRWYTLIRLHRDDDMLALPVSLPADDAIPAPAVKPLPRFTRVFEKDRSFIQRESIDLDPGTERVAYLVSATLCSVMMIALVLALRRLDATSRQPLTPAATGDAEPSVAPADSVFT